MTRIQHVALRTQDLGASCRFYAEVLGVATGRTDEAVGRAWLDFPDGFTLIFDYAETPPDPPTLTYLGLELESFAAVDELVEKLEASVVIERDMRETYRNARGPYGFFIRDPNGYRLKVFTYNDGE